MRYSISAMAKASGVSARMLRHYDRIGLLRPAYVGPNGYRWYGRAELLRLQRIMVLRRFGLGLERIGDVLREEVGEDAALRAHLADLRAERARLDQVIDTVQETLADLEDARITDPARFFTGLRTDAAAMRERLVDAFCEQAGRDFDASMADQAELTPGDHAHAAAQGAALLRRLAEVMRAGTPPDAPEALDAVAEHHAALLAYWRPTPAAYAALGPFIRSDPWQRASAERADPDLPEWLAQAVEAYARLRLGHTPAPD